MTDLEIARDLLHMADERGGWFEEELGDRNRWAIQQAHLAAIAHALIAIAEKE